MHNMRMGLAIAPETVQNAAATTNSQWTMARYNNGFYHVADKTAIV